MIQVSFGSLFKTESICLEALGAAAIVGAMKYTLGKNPYGYRGLGDVFVFIFFGLVSVLGGYYVAARELPPLIMLLPASAIGCFSVGVLNVNNIRDMKTDAVNRVTVAIKLGMKGARIYQTILVTLGWALILVFARSMISRRDITYSSSLFHCTSSTCKVYGPGASVLSTRCCRCL